MVGGCSCISFHIMRSLVVTPIAERGGTPGQEILAVAPFQNQLFACSVGSGKLDVGGVLSIVRVESLCSTYCTCN